jgi:hypothetical protein
MKFDLKLAFSTVALLYSLSSPLHAMEADIAELFEGSDNPGTLNVRQAETDLKLISDDQFKKLATRACKIAFPENTGIRASFLNCLVHGRIKSTEELQSFVASLEENKEDYYKLRTGPRLDEFKKLLGPYLTGNRGTYFTGSRRKHLTHHPTSLEEKAEAIQANICKDLEKSTVSKLKMEELPYRDLEPIRTRLVFQSEYSVAAEGDTENVLTTCGVDTCVAVGIHNPLLKRAGLAHCSYQTKLGELKFVYQVCRDEDKNKVKIYLLSSCKETLSNIYLGLKVLGFSDHVFTIIEPMGASELDVGIDSKNGSFFSFNSTPHLLNEMRPDVVIPIK